jgi:hypothetical protein
MIEGEEEDKRTRQTKRLERDISLCNHDIPNTETHIVEFAQVAGVFAAAAGRPMVGEPLLMLPNSRFC